MADDLKLDIGKNLTAMSNSLKHITDSIPHVDVSALTIPKYTIDTSYTNKFLEDQMRSQQEVMESIAKERERKENEERRHKEFLEEEAKKQTAILEKLGASTIDDLPQMESLIRLKKDIDAQIKMSGYASSLDHLHTYVCAYIEDICKKNSVEISNDKHGHCDLGQTMGKLSKYYIENKIIESEIGVILIRQFSGTLQHFNSLRNNNTYAHSPNIINELEAKFITNTIITMLDFISSLERQGGIQ